jgi:hypothetical protein
LSGVEASVEQGKADKGIRAAGDGLEAARWRGTHVEGQQGWHWWLRDPMRGAWWWRGDTPRQCGHPRGESSGGELARVESSGGSSAARRGRLLRGQQRGGWGQGDAGEGRWQARGGKGKAACGETSTAADLCRSGEVGG